MAWAIGTAAPPAALRRADDGCAAASSTTSGSRDERAAAAHPQGATQPLTLAGVPTGFLPWLAADLARAAHGTGKGGRAVVIAADEAAMRALADTVPVFAPEVEVLTLPAWDCLPYDRASPGAAGDGRAAGDAPCAAGAAQGAATAGHHRQCRDPAGADPVPHPPADPAARRGRADRPRRAGRAARGQSATSAPTRSHDAGEYAVRGSIVDLFPAGEAQRAAARFLRRRDRDDAPLRPRRPALDRQGRGVHADAGVARPCSTRTASSASARAIARRSAPTPPATRSTRRSATAGGWPAWSIGCRCSRRSSRPCSTISASMTSSSATAAPMARSTSRRRSDRGLLRQPRRGRWWPSRAATARCPRRRSILPKKEWRRRGRRPRRSTSPPPSPSPRATRVIDFAVERPARFRARARAERQCLRSGRRARRQASERAGERSSSPATRRARASGSPGCSRIMG